MRIFGSERIQTLMDKLGLEDDEAIDNKMVTKAIENAQKKVEGNNFDIRKNLIGYDDVMNMQREVIYKQRSEVLEGKDIKDQVLAMTRDVVEDAVKGHLEGNVEDKAEVMDKLIKYLENICLPKGIVNASDLLNLSINNIIEKVLEILYKVYDAKEEELGSERMRELERVILLRSVDRKWMDHIDNMDHLKQGMGLRAYKQMDPIQAYQMEGSAMFDEMIHGIKIDTVRFLFHIEIKKEEPVERERVAQETSAQHAGSSSTSDVKKQPVRNDNKVGRNDPCPCGSGNKYKNCHGREA
jgi:preprotein translocase subunit SecA